VPARSATNRVGDIFNVQIRFEEDDTDHFSDKSSGPFASDAVRII
jgi:hypothetical protein